MFIIFQFLPLVAILLIIFAKFKEITLWEVLIGIVTTGIVTYAGYKGGEYAAIQDVEFFSNSIIELKYYEYWETWVDQTCTEDYDCNCRDEAVYSTNSQGTRYQSGTRRVCDRCTRTYDCSYCDKNRPYYEITLNTGNTQIISDSYGEDIKRKWKESELFVDMNRRIDKSGICGEDGDAYSYKWDKKEGTAFTYCSEHSYENRIQASENLYRDYRKVDKEKTVDYPKVLKNGKQTHLMGYDNPATEQFLQYVNGVYGKEKQIKYFVYVWPDSASINVVENQKAYWLRCNKNEFILCLFVDRNGQVKNIDFITWSEKNYNPVLSYKGTVEEVVRKTWDYLESNWVRLEFSKFEFLTVRPSNTAFVLTLLANLIILSIIMSLFFRNIHEKNTIT